jgi:hypothetical protein
MGTDNDAIGVAFQSADLEKTCPTSGIRGFPLDITWKNFDAASKDDSLRFRPQFGGPSWWAYDATKGLISNYQNSASSYYLQGKTYDVAAMRIVTETTHYRGVAELNIWGVNHTYNAYSVIVIPIIGGSTTNEGLKLEHMLNGSGSVSVQDIFPQGDNVNIYYYSTCAPYVDMGSSGPKGYGGLNINVVFFAYPLYISTELYRRLISNSMKAAGIPISIIQPSWVFSPIKEVDIHNIVKIGQVFGNSDELKAKTIFRKNGFTIPKAAGAKGYKVFEVDANTLKNGNYVANLDGSQNLEDYLQGVNRPEEIAPPESIVKPRSIARTIGIVLGVIILIVISMALWYVGKKVFTYFAGAGSGADGSVDVAPAPAPGPGPGPTPAGLQPTKAVVQPTMPKVTNLSTKPIGPSAPAPVPTQ